uniref:Uncharacterized protein n=1 Tax=Romanomermis culicivorax TaxID=13658 RepID=A0A915KHS6_ROMCU
MYTLKKYTFNIPVKIGNIKTDAPINADAEYPQIFERCNFNCTSMIACTEDLTWTSMIACTEDLTRQNPIF